MLARYQIKRGQPAAELPGGIRRDARKHTRHCLRPSAEMVDAYLDDPSDAGWRAFANAYRKLIDRRFREDSGPFDQLAEDANQGDVHIGCSCPTKKNPDVRHCHTWMALEFMGGKYPDLEVVFPST